MLFWLLEFVTFKARATHSPFMFPLVVPFGAKSEGVSMSALGQKLTFRSAIAMSALPPKADIAERDCHVRFVPKADILQCIRVGFRPRPATATEGPPLNRQQHNSVRWPYSGPTKVEHGYLRRMF
jgi:hypothetical protein